MAKTRINAAAAARPRACIEMADEWALDESHTNRLLDAAALVAAELVVAGALTLC